MPQKPIKPKNLSRLKTYFKDQLSTLTLSLAAAHLRAAIIYCLTSTGAEMSKRADLSRKLPSDAQYLLEYMDTVPSDRSDDDFDGYLSDEQGADIDDSGSEEEDCTEPSNSSEEYQGRQQSMC